MCIRDSKTSVRWEHGITELEKWLGIKIDRVDVFDNSHLFGKNPVGSMIVASKDGFVKSEYRHYKLENESVAGNDIGMMSEFLTRAFKNINDISQNTRLVIVDGGRAQWNIAQKVLGGKIPVLGIVKGVVRSGDEHFILPDGKESTDVQKSSELFLILRAMRDEAHRFAISFHRKTRAKSSLSGALDAVSYTHLDVYKRQRQL